MGAPIQASMFFKQGNSGWSEVLTMNPELFATLKDAQREISKPNGLGQLRVYLLGAGASLIGIRLSKYGVWRDSNYTAALPTNPPGEIWTHTPYSDTDVACNPWDVLSVRLECGDSYRRLVYLSGAPDSEYTKADPSKWTATFSGAFNKYFNYLTGKDSFTANRYGTMVSSKNTVDPPVTNLVSTPPNDPVYTVVNGQGQLALTRSDGPTQVSIGQKIRLLGVKGPPGVDLRKWNGVFTVVQPTVGNTFKIATKISPAVADFPTLDFSGAYVFNPQPIFQPFTDWDWEGKTHRKRGVAFGTPRGRSRSQV